MSYCTNCGELYPTEAKFCAKCGNIIDNGSVTETGIPIKYGTILFTRKQGPGLQETNVCLDGNIVGSVKYGERVSIKTEYGQHCVELFINKNKKIELKININENTPIMEVIFVFKMGMASPNIKLISVGPYVEKPRINLISHGFNEGQSQIGRKCPKCGGQMNIQAVSESKKTGCLTILFYILLAISILGWLILIPLALRKKTKTSTYAICQNCGYKVSV